MYFLAFVLSILALGSSVIANPIPSSSTTEAITRAAYRTAYFIDTKNYNSLNEVWTKDIVYDSTDLGQYGGKSTGLEQAAAAAQRSTQDVRTSALVTNLFVLDMITPKKARVNTYITFSRWDDNALHDISKTFRIFYRCDDIWVLQDDSWKLQSSKVYNMGYGVEAPYYGNGN